MPLQLVLGAMAVAAAAAVGCRDDEGCSLNGVCASGACHCYAPWAGPSCGTLETLPQPRVPAYGGAGNASWGGSVVAAGGAYHLYVSTMTEGCGLLDWQTNMNIVHAVSSAPRGPYQLQATALPSFSTNPQVIEDKGVLWMFHIGNGAGNTTGKNCSRAAAAAVGGAPSATVGAPRPPPAPPPPAAQIIHRASLPEGPWTAVTLDGVDCNNPSPFRGSDGVYRLMCDWHMYTSTVGFGGPWSAKPLLVPGIASDQTGAVGPGGSARRGARMEDPCETDRLPLSPNLECQVLYQDKRGHYHVLGHMFVSAGCGKLNEPTSVSPSCNFISGHAYSRAGLGNWTLSPTEPFSFKLTYDDGTTGLLSTRERPKLLFDPRSGEPSHLITAGAPMPPGACLSCTKTRKSRDARACVGCKSMAPWDLQVFTMVTPLRQQQ